MRLPFNLVLFALSAVVLYARRPRSLRRQARGHVAADAAQPTRIV